MLGILVKIISLDLAATLSPGLLALAIVILGSKYHPKLRTLALLLGTLLVALAIAIIGLNLGQAAPSGIKLNLTTAIVDLVIGAIFIFFGIKTIVSKEKTIKTEGDPGTQIAKWIIVGFIISATNFDAVFLSLAAAKEVGGSGIQAALKWLLLLVNILFFCLPIIFPLVFYLVAPGYAQNVLSKVNQFVLRYSRYVIFLMFIVFGLIFAIRGLRYFI